MGSNDTAEQLAVCHEVNVSNEARIAALESQLTHAKEQLRERARAFEARGQRIAELETDLNRHRRALAVANAQIADLEHENTRLESALGDRLRHDSHGLALAEADRDDARRRLAAVLALVDPRRDDPTPLPAGVIRRILTEVTAEPVGTWLPPDDARITARALRGLAGIIDATRWNTDGDPAHTDTSRLTALADRIAS